MDMMIEKVIMFAIIILVSIIASKAGWLGDTVREGLSRLIMKVTAPLMLFTSIASLEYKPSMVREAGTILALSVVIIVLLVLIGRLYVRFSSLSPVTKGVQISLMSFGNVAFIAYPLFEAVFGPIGVFYGAFYHLANDVLFWTVGVSHIGSAQNKSFSERLRHIINPNLVGVNLGILFFLFQIPVAPVLFDPLAGLGKTTVYLSLVFVGATMATVDIRSTYKKLSIYAIVLVKMLLVPALAAALFALVYDFGLSTVAVSALVLQIAMPCMTLIAITANEMKSDYQYAAEAVFATTAVSLVTMPLILKLLEALWSLS